MGLTVKNLDSLIYEANDRDYFIYLLDYGWEEPLTDVMYKNFDIMALESEETHSVVVRGIESRHFANEVFSWHNINGQDGRDVLPAIMLTTLPPSYFKYVEPYTPLDDLLLLIPLKRICRNSSDFIMLIKNIFSDIKSGKGLSNFEIALELKRDGIKQVYDSLILQPNLNGVGIDLKKLFEKYKKTT